MRRRAAAASGASTASNVSDWLAARSTTGAIHSAASTWPCRAPNRVRQALAAAVRAGGVEEAGGGGGAPGAQAGRPGRVLAGAEPVVPAPPPPPAVDGEALAREVAVRGCVLVRNEPLPGHPAPDTSAGLEGARVKPTARALPLEPRRRARHRPDRRRRAGTPGPGRRIGQVFPARVVAPLDGLRAALPEDDRERVPGRRPQ